MEPTTSNAPLPLEIRAAAHPDRDVLLALVAACIAGMRAQGIEQWDEHYPNAAAIDRDLAEGTAYLGLIDGTVVAMIAINEFQDAEYAEVPWQWTDGAIAVVHRLMVHPASEGRGVARAMMAFAEGTAVTTGHAIVRLDAFGENPRALRLYQALGYRDAGSVRFRKGIFRCFEKRVHATP